MASFHNIPGNGLGDDPQDRLAHGLGSFPDYAGVVAADVTLVGAAFAVDKASPQTAANLTFAGATSVAVRNQVITEVVDTLDFVGADFNVRIVSGTDVDVLGTDLTLEFSAAEFIADHIAEVTEAVLTIVGGDVVAIESGDYNVTQAVLSIVGANFERYNSLNANRGAAIRAELSGQGDYSSIDFTRPFITQEQLNKLDQEKQAKLAELQKLEMLKKAETASVANAQKLQKRIDITEKEIETVDKKLRTYKQQISNEILELSQELSVSLVETMNEMKPMLDFAEELLEAQQYFDNNIYYNEVEWDTARGRLRWQYKKRST